MTLRFGSHSPVAAFTGAVTSHRSLQLLNNVRGPLPVANFAAKLATKHAATATSSTALNINPIAIMGGAASTVAVNTDTLSAAALVTMFLLALQYCAQPPLTRKFLDSRANKKGITMVEEIVKMGLSAFFFLSCGE